MNVSVKVDAQKAIGAFSNSSGQIARAVDQWAILAGSALLREARKEIPVKTGKGAASLYSQSSGTSFSIGSDLKYVKFIVSGTKPHTITPNRAKVLRFKVGGRTIFAKMVRHPGTKSNNFLKRALENQQDHIRSLAEKIIADRLNGTNTGGLLG